MTTLYECDWCGERTYERDHVASVDVTIGATNEQLHMCVGCAPDGIKQQFPA